MSQEKRGIFKWTDTDEQGNQKKEPEFQISEHGNNHQVTNWQQDNILGPNPNMNQVLDRMRAIHANAHPNSQPRPSGFGAFSFGSPGCAFYWIAGKLYYR